MTLQFVQAAQFPEWMSNHLATLDTGKLRVLYMKGFSTRVDVQSSPLIGMYLQHAAALDVDLIEFNGDDYTPNGFTAVVEHVAAAQPQALLVAHLCHSDLGRFRASWSDRPTKILVVITADQPFEQLGRTAMTNLAPYAATQIVHCIGGGSTLLAEYHGCVDAAIRFQVLPISRPLADGGGVECCALVGLAPRPNLEIMTWGD